MGRNAKENAIPSEKIDSPLFDGGWWRKKVRFLGKPSGFLFFLSGFLGIWHKLGGGIDREMSFKSSRVEKSLFGVKLSGKCC